MSELAKLVSYLKSKDNKDIQKLINLITTALDDMTGSVSIEEYSDFVELITDKYSSLSTSVRLVYLKLVKAYLNSDIHCNTIIAKNFHWAIVSSLELDGDHAVAERIQAIKLVKAFLKISPDKFPLTFARTLVAIGNYKDDQLRRICIEILRELALVNTELVAHVNGFYCLLEAVLDPSTSDMGESIVMSILYLINDHHTRQHVKPFLDLRVLLSPFSDLDTDISDLMLRWKSAKNALITMLRTWVGVYVIASDPLGLSSLINMLKDTKVSSQVQVVILDALHELFEPIISKIQTINTNPIEADVWIMPLNNEDEDSQNNNQIHRRTLSKASTTTDTQRTDGGGGGGGGGGNREDGGRGSIFNSFIRAASPFTPTFKKTTTSTTITAPNSPNLMSNLMKDRKQSEDFTVYSSPGPESGEKIESKELDRIYNVLDSYATLVVCAFISNGLIDSLIHLGTFNDGELGKKARSLLLDFFGIVVRILPDYFCAELLTTPTLLEFATNFRTAIGEANRASQILLSIAQCFSSMPTSSSSSTGGGSNKLFSSTATVYDDHESVSDTSHTHTTAAAGVGGSGLKTRETAVTLSLMSDKKVTNPQNYTSSSIYNISPLTGRFIPPSNIRTLKDLILDRTYYRNINPTGISNSNNNSGSIYYTTQSPASSYMNNHAASSSSSAVYSNLLQDLNTRFIIPMDRQEFKKQIDASRTTGKEGKEPLKWDWAVIHDMLHNSFTTTDRLTEVLETKWCRRVVGFFRCSTEEKGYFANMDWEPANLFYLQCLCDLYAVLLMDPKGISFIENDRKTTIFDDITRDLEHIISNQQGLPSSPVILNNSTITTTTGATGPMNSTNTLSYLVFRFTASNQTMAREYFAFLGTILTYDHGFHMIEKAKLLDTILKLGCKKSLEYLGRAVISGLIFHDKGIYSAVIMRTWCQNHTISIEFILYLKSLLYALYQSNIYDFLKWGIEIVILFLEEHPCPYITRIYNEIIQDTRVLCTIFQKRLLLSKLYLLTTTSTIFLTCCLSMEEGIEYLKNNYDLSGLIQQSMTPEQSIKYASTVETSLINALSTYHIKKRSSTTVCTVTIPTYPLKRNTTSSTTTTTISPTDSSTTSSHPMTSSHGGLNPFQGLMRIPWNIEAKITTSMNPNATMTSNIMPTSEYLRVDTFIDITDYPLPTTTEISSDSMRIVKARGVITDTKGIPTGYPVSANKIVSCCLLAGTSSVNRQGKLISSSSVVSYSKKNNMNNNTHTRMSSASPSDMSYEDLPTTIYCDHIHDWSHCRPHHRYNNAIILNDGKLAVTIPEYPVTWIFSRHRNISELSDILNNSSMSGGGLPIDTSKDNHRTLYLVEIQYNIKLESGLPVYVPLSRHMFGELAHTKRGCELLIHHKVVQQYLSIIYDQEKNMSERKGALWSLGHICSKDYGYKLVTQYDSTFIDWCLNYLTTGSNIGLRAVIFHVLGLISRSEGGSAKLNESSWIHTHPRSTCAIAIPILMSTLFTPITNDGGESTYTYELTLTQQTRMMLYKKDLSSVELEVLDIIMKMPGVILYNDSKARLESIKTRHPTIIQNKNLYYAVRELLDRYTYKLSARRDIMNFFRPNSRKMTSSRDYVQ